MDIHNLYDRLTEGRTFMERVEDTPAKGYHMIAWLGHLSVHDRHCNTIAEIWPGLVEVHHTAAAEARALGLPVGEERDNAGYLYARETFTPVQAWDYLSTKMTAKPEAGIAEGWWAGYRLVQLLPCGAVNVQWQTPGGGIPVVEVWSSLISVLCGYEREAEALGLPVGKTVRYGLHIAE